MSLTETMMGRGQNELQSRNFILLIVTKVSYLIVATMCSANVANCSVELGSCILLFQHKKLFGLTLNKISI